MNLLIPLLATVCIVGPIEDATAQNYHAIQVNGLESFTGLMSTCGNLTLVEKTGRGVVYHDEVYTKEKLGISPLAVSRNISVPVGYSANNYGDVAGVYKGKPCALYDGESDRVR